MATNKTALFVNKQAGGVFNVVDVSAHPGNVWFVDSGHADASDSAGGGRNPELPFATLNYANSKCTASNGDVIYVAPGHAETKSVTGSLFALNVAGVRVIGLGAGALRPTFTLSHTGAATTISAANVTLENVIFVAGVDSVLAPLTVSAADVTLRNIEFRDAANVEFAVGVLTSNAADRLHVDGMHYRGDMATGDALTIGINLAGVNDALIENCLFESKAASTAWVNFSVACVNVHVRSCIFNDSTTTLTKDVVDTATGSTWSVSKCFDLRGGYTFSGGSGSALASEDTSALAAAIAVIDAFHDVGTADAVTNVVMSDVIGNKADAAAAGVVSTEESLVAYAKQNVTAGIAAAAAIVVIDEFHDVPAANNVLNAQINEVIGNKTDAGAEGAVTATDTLVGYVKQLVTAAIAADAWAVKTVVKTGLALDGGDVADVFTVAGGPIELLGFNMLITTAVSANACTVYFLSDPTLADYADTPLCGAAEINAAAIGNVFSILDADSSTVWVKNADGTNVGRMLEIGSQFVMAGGIDFKTQNADPSTGVASVYLTYRPLSNASVVTASA